MKAKSLYEKVRETKPRFYPGKTLTKLDVKEIEAMAKRIRALEGALRDYQDRQSA